jgi:crotonobetainyl-CoA:carnitine CoA-transferase CaiB-like acyl-CoA transferase
MPGALEGFKVVDASEAIGGQYCARLFADYGADVTLVEPKAGSVVRGMPPFSTRQDGHESLLFFHLNLGKRSICLDLASEDGERIFRGLLRDADVAILPEDLERRFAPDIGSRCITAT